MDARLTGLEVVRDKTEGGLSVQSGQAHSVVPRPASFNRLQAAQQALGFVNQLGWRESEPEMPPPEQAAVVRLMIDSVPAQPALGEMTMSRFQKSVIVIFKRRIPVGNQHVTEVGSDGTILVQLDASGGLIRAWKLWKKLVTKGTENVIPMPIASQKWQQIMDELSAGDTMAQKPTEWGFQTVRRTPGGNEELRFFLRATFDPVDEEETPGSFHQVIDLSANAQSTF